MLKGVLGSTKAKPEPEGCRDDGWAGRGSEELCRAGTVGVNGEVQDATGADLGEAEPDEAEEVPGGRAGLWMLGGVGGLRARGAALAAPGKALHVGFGRSWSRDALR